ncbi:hypothetical protein RFI_36086, partial [Reticulomyxa filosa]
DVLSDPDNGATACLKAVLKQPLRERGSLRGEFMGNLAQKIKSMLAEILALVFENRTSSLYRSTKEPNTKIDELFLQLLSEPKIVRVSQRTQVNQDRQIVLKDDIPDDALFISVEENQLSECDSQLDRKNNESFDEGLFLVDNI